MLEILKLIALLLTIATGLLSFFKPEAVYAFTGLSANGARGVSEIRAILGGLLIGLGIAPLILGGAVAYQVVGIAYLGIAITRAISIVIDKSYASSNIISLVVELIVAPVLMI